MNPTFIRHQFTDADLPPLLTAGEPFVTLDHVQSRPGDPALEQMENNIVCKSAVQRACNIATWFQDLQAAKDAVQLAQATLDHAQEASQAAVRQLQAVAPVHMPLLVLTVFATLVALFTEIGLTWSVLPAFLNVPSDSVLGYAMGGLTLVLTMALEQLLDPVIGLLEDLVRAEKGSRARVVGLAVAGVLTAVALGLNTVVLIKLGLAREEAAKLLQMLLNMATTTAMPELDPQVSVGLVIWVGVVTVLDSALVMRPVLSGLRDGMRRWSAKRLITRREVEVSKLRPVLIAAEGKAAIRQAWYDGAEQRAQELSAAVESRDRAQLAEIRGRQAPQMKLELAAVVEEALRPGRLASWRRNPEEPAALVN